MTGKKNPEYLCDTQVDGASGGYKITMTGAMISSYQTGGSGGDVAPVSDKLNLDYGVVSRKDIRRG